MFLQKVDNCSLSGEDPVLVENKMCKDFCLFSTINISEAHLHTIKLENDNSATVFITFPIINKVSPSLL